MYFKCRTVSKRGVQLEFAKPLRTNEVFRYQLMFLILYGLVAAHSLDIVVVICDVKVV